VDEVLVVGHVDGSCDGRFDGLSVDGDIVVSVDGLIVGHDEDGVSVGLSVGTYEGVMLGVLVVGFDVGFFVGNDVGFRLGRDVGSNVGV